MAPVLYAVVKIDRGQRGTKEVLRYEFSCVEDAITKHREVKNDYTDSTYWELVVEYE